MWEIKQSAVGMVMLHRSSIMKEESLRRSEMSVQQKGTTGYFRRKALEALKLLRPPN